MIDGLVKSGNLVIHFIEENSIYDTSAKAHDKLVMYVRRIMAKFFVDIMKEKSFEGTIKKLEKGEYPGYAPLGYYNNVLTSKKEKDPERWDLVMELWKLAKTGKHTLTDLTDIMRNKGLTVRVQKRSLRGIKEPRVVNKCDIQRILKNPFYSGQFNFYAKLWSNKGINNDLEPTYPAMISMEDFTDAQEAMSDKGTGRGVKKKACSWFYKGIINCAYCDCGLAGYKKKDKYIYYHCSSGKHSVDPNWYKNKFGERAKKVRKRKGETIVSYACPQQNWKEEEIDEVIQKTLEELYFDENVFDWLRKRVGEDIEEKQGAIQSEIKSLNIRKAKVETDLKTLILSKKNYSEDIELKVYHEELENLKSKVEEITDRIAELQEESQENMEEAIDSLELAYSFKNKHLQVDEDTKQIMLKMMFRTIYAGDAVSMFSHKPSMVVPSMKDGKYNQSKSLGFVWKEPFRTLFDIKFIQEVSEIDAEKAKNKNWYARTDSNCRPTDS